VKTPRIVAAAIALVALAPGPVPVRAQGSDVLRVAPAAREPEPAALRIRVEATRSHADGGERPSGGFLVPTTSLGETYERSFSIMPGGCGGGSAPYILNDAVAGWHVWVTPVAVAGDAVTFRILWERSPNGNTDAWNPGSEQTLTLRPGESVPLDVISAPPGPAPASGPCGATGLRASVITWPPPEDDRRLVSTDLWLVERRPDGTERTQQLTVRGLFSQVTPFFFDAFEDNGALLEFQGEFTATPGTDQVVLALTTRSRVAIGDDVSSILRDGVMMRGREVASTLRLTSDETETVDLPRLGENDGGAFPNHTFSIRVRSRQVR
jgi:hypothetical protein